MPEIKFTQSELDKRSKRLGVYASLNASTKGVETLKVAVVNIVESGFRDYARAHKGCNAEMENREWLRFKKHLLKYL